jgi:hypothetical protein
MEKQSEKKKQTHYETDVGLGETEHRQPTKIPPSGGTPGVEEGHAPSGGVAGGVPEDKHKKAS